MLLCSIHPFLTLILTNKTGQIKNLQGYKFIFVHLRSLNFEIKAYFLVYNNEYTDFLF